MTPDRTCYIVYISHAFLLYRHAACTSCQGCTLPLSTPLGLRVFISYGQCVPTVGFKQTLSLLIIVNQSEAFWPKDKSKIDELFWLFWKYFISLSCEQFFNHKDEVDAWMCRCIRFWCSCFFHIKYFLAWGL